MLVAPVKILEWTPDYSVHVSEIDREHQTLFSVINRLHEAMLGGEGKSILATLLSELTQYTLHHLTNEERAMAAIEYPRLRAHALEHDELRRGIRAFGERLARGEATITIELTLFLSEWIKRHVLTTDLELGDAIRQNRIHKQGVDVIQNVFRPDP